MTPLEYKRLKHGDVVEHDTIGSRYVVLEGFAHEVITQIAKDAMKNTFGRYKVVLQVKRKRKRK